MRPGGVATVAALVAGGLIDCVCIAVTGDSITAACRRHPAVTVGAFAVFGLHVADRLGRADPFRALGRGAQLCVQSPWRRAMR